MKLENSIKIDLDEIILLARKEKPYQYDGKFGFTIDWGILKEKPKTLLCFSKYLLDENIGKDELTREILKKQLEILDVNKIVNNELQRILENELNSFIGKNINNISYFFEKEEKADVNGNKYYQNPSFLNYLGDIGINMLEGKGSIKQKAETMMATIKYDEIGNAKLKYKEWSYNNDKIGFEVDLKKNKIITEPSEILSIAYSKDDLKHILAYKQYELGLTPEFYNEIAKINEFLKDKKTVTVILDNVKRKIDANINDIFDFTNGKFFLNWRGLGIPSDNKSIDIKRIKSLKYGGNELVINTNNLIPLQEQLDELIQTNEKGIICNIERDDNELEQE